LEKKEKREEAWTLKTYFHKGELSQAMSKKGGVKGRGKRPGNEKN